MTKFFSTVDQYYMDVRSVLKPIVSFWSSCVVSVLKRFYMVKNKMEKSNA